MNDTRRGFLKTLGKLGAVLGLTAAACSAHHHGHHKPHHPKHPKRPTSETEALSHAIQKAGFNRTNGGDDMTWESLDALKAHKRTAPTAKPAPVVTFGDTPNVPNGRYGAGFTGFKKASNEQILFAGNVTVTNRPSVKTAVEATSRHQEWLNRITMARIDNISETLRIPVLLEDLSD